MRRKWSPWAIPLGACLIVSSCSSPGVELTRSDQLQRTDTINTAPDDTASDDTAPIDTTPDYTTPDDTTPDATTPDATTPTDKTPIDTAPDGTAPAGTAPEPGGSRAENLPAIDPVVWGPCAQEPDPWQCGSITVPMDYGEPGGRQISVAVIRLPAGVPAARIGSLVLNPGGPGGSGLTIAYEEAGAFPTELLDRFDLVGFDPRGVGRSTAVRCPAGVESAFDRFDECISLTGELLSHLGTPNVARDLEMIRKAVQDEQLTYLGFSYGTALGAVYADMFPERVRALVLDGAVDPDAGTSNTDAGGGYDFYAEEDFDGTLEVFHDLCDATPECAAGPDSRQLLDHVYDIVRDTPAPYFSGGERVTGSDVDDVIFTSMYSAFNWYVLAVALRDAADGDASALAAMSSWLRFGYPADMEADYNFDFANIAIRCADFENRAGSFDCEDFPPTDESLPVIRSVDASTPVLVVGTKDDPATPGRYAPLLAAALGDAVAIAWEGAGHTAFLTSACITELVTDYLVDQTVPVDGTSCPFVVGTATLAERADAVFAGDEPDAAAFAIMPLLDQQHVPSRLAPCVAAAIVERGGHRLIVHQMIGVESPELVHFRTVAATRCQLSN